MKEINLKMKLGEDGVALFENGSEPPLNKFNLNYGENEARFSITTRYQVGNNFRRLGTFLAMFDNECEKFSLTY